MSLLSAIVFGVLFGAGVHLMKRGDLTRLVAGSQLIANATILLIVSAGFRDRVVPLVAEGNPSLLADPLVQALALTAVVINFATAVLLMRLMVAVERTHTTLSTEDLVRAEVSDAARTERPGEAR